MSARITLSFSLLWLVAALLPASAQKTLRAFDPNLMDTTADPCVNFFQYSCGGYLKTYAGQGSESVLLADWTSLHLDIIARDRGLMRCAGSLYHL